MINYHLDGEVISIAEWSDNSSIKLDKKTNVLEIIKNANVLHYKINNEVVYSSEFYPFFGNKIGIIVNDDIKIAVGKFYVSN